MHLTYSKYFSDNGLVPTVGSNGIWTICGEKCALGVVLYAEFESKITLVRKAHKNEYEFSGRYALPGGLVRHGSRNSFEQAARTSLLSRVASECGIVIKNEDDLIFLDFGPPPVTRYTVKGESRYTLVFCGKLSLENESSLEPSDRSIDKAIWCDVPPPWDKLAPANAVILSNIMWQKFNSGQREQAREHVVHAFDLCTTWAVELGLPKPNLPWGS